MNAKACELLTVLEDLPGRGNSPWQRLRADIERFQNTAFGEAHGFSAITNEQEFRDSVPVREYGEYSSWVERVAAGGENILPCGRVLAFERTSGTSTGAKLIPVTEGLREDFAHGLSSWLGSWRRECPEVFDGRAYWAISPPGIQAGKTAGDLPVGLDGDGSYFPESIGAALAEWLVVPDFGGVAENIFKETAEKLLSTEDLSLVSVWSPTFLLGIAAEVARLRPGMTWKRIWPKLALVSCWADASSARWIPMLEERLGGIRIEPKGLLSTEGVTSIPIAGKSRLAHECHYHEFIDGEGNHLPVDQLRIGTECEILLSTSGGLMRYRSGDRVRITGFTSSGVPEMIFEGRKGRVSDLVGEKLDEKSVSEALLRVGVRGFVAADTDAPGYELWLERTEHAGAVVGILRENPYFQQALDLGQLAPVKIQKLRRGWTTDISFELARKQRCRIGDVKIPLIIRQEHTGEVAEWLG